MGDEVKQELALEIMSGPDDGRRVQFRRNDGDGTEGPNDTWVFTVGRRDDCDLCLPFDTQISRVHARLVFYPDQDGWYLEDSGSRNGTYVGKERVLTPVRLEARTLFRVGRTWLRLVCS